METAARSDRPLPSGPTSPGYFMPMPSPEPDNLFPTEESAPLAEVDHAAPLAARMRPRTLEEFVGQAGVVGEGTLLRRAIERDQLTSVLFWGPPGSGKSTLAQIIARATKAHF